jgi:hypothetical protein
MIEQPYSLIPFPGPINPVISLAGNLLLQNNLLALRYALTGEIEAVSLPPAALNPRRKDELWKATCFEFFLAIKDLPGYWEFNMSPSGDWNVYRMDVYRRVGFREETAISHLPFEFKKESDQCSLDVSVDLTSILRPKAELQIGITAIIQTRNYDETYWALVHPGPHADFHLRESFILEPAGQTRPSGQSARAG